MTYRRTTISAALVAGLVLAGCGSTQHPTTTRTATSTTTTQTVASGSAMLRRAVVAAVDADHKTSNTALWTNAVPAKPVATAGPALTNLRRSVAGRRKQGIRIRMLHERFRVLNVRLDPSYTTASAELIDAEKVQPTHESGKPLGKSLSTTERAELELHRVPGTNRFVVWKVQDLQ
jgi:outer membrane murein-binding lipoprotein Lpp